MKLTIPDMARIMDGIHNSPHGSRNLEWLESNFKATEYGFLVYKTFGSSYQPPSSWGLSHNGVWPHDHTYYYNSGDLPRVISARCDPRIYNSCSHGVNFGTYRYMSWLQTSHWVYLCLLLWEDVSRCVVLPSQDKARSHRLVVLRHIGRRSLRELHQS